MISLLLFFSCQEAVEIPTINIITKDSIGWETKKACQIEYLQKSSSSTILAKVKFRGGASSRYAKHSFSLELESQYPLGNLKADDDWIINATYIDKTFMRHKICYDLFRKMNSNNIASECAYINLTIDKKPEGLYVLMEEVNGAMVGVNKSDSLAMVFKDPPIFYREKLTFVQDSLNYYQQKYPNHTKNDKSYYLEKFKDFLFYSSDVNFSKNINQWVDIDNILDWHLLLLFSNNSDGIMKNFYLYKLDTETPFRVAIWDYDHSFGRDGDNELNMMVNELNCNRSILLKRLMHIKETNYAKKLKAKWFQHRSSKVISYDYFDELIKENDFIIRKAVIGNAEIWPVNEKWYFDANNYNQELEIMRKFVKLRINELDNYFNNL